MGDSTSVGVLQREHRQGDERITQPSRVYCKLGAQAASPSLREDRDGHSSVIPIAITGHGGRNISSFPHPHMPLPYSIIMIPRPDCRLVPEYS